MKFTYPSELPVSAARDDIAKAVSSSQVVIVSGQTGSGKTTQLPKILLELGRGTHGRQIVHTQPRRLAARTVAERIASEMGVHLGDEIGYQVRFTDETSPKTRLRVVTDGILLAQIQRDPQLRQYDTIVIDEAHERSLNIDFLLGYLTALLPKRRDLKLIITSATIDSVKFQEHFEHALHEKVPVIEVSGRTYPVQVVYEPLGTAPALMRHVPGFETGAMPGEESYAELSAAPSDGGRDRGSSREPDMDMPTAVARACAELIIHSSHERGARDILVFASGERDIHEFENALRRHYGPRADDMRHPDAIEIMPLFARLSSKEQHRVFEPHTHQRIVIATNVAETSLTVPGIRYVVDPGTARISRYSKTAKVQRLPIEPISQASADQRSGRCGRIADGIAIRLYSREDYETRPRFTEPEILRTSLGAVVLHMLSVGVARTAEDVTNFGFIDPPDMKAVSDGFNELTELKAIGRKRGEVTLTHVGRQLARIPIDVRLGRMVIEAAKSSTPDTLAAVLVIVAFLSLQDPRERPDEARDEADRIHNRYADPSSDYLTALNIWDRIFQADGEPSNNALRRICKSEYFSWLRVRQWKDLVNQLTEMCRELKFKVGSPHRSGGTPAADQPAGGPFAVLLVGRPRHSHVDALRPAVDDGHADRARAEGLRFRRSQGRGEGQGHQAGSEDGEERLSGRARHSFRIVPGLGRGQIHPAVGDEHGTGGDEPPVGEVQRRHRPGVGRAAGRAADPHHVCGAALVWFARLRRRHGEGAAVRSADHLGPHRAMGAHQPHGGPRLPDPAGPCRGGRPAAVQL